MVGLESRNDRTLSEMAFDGLPDDLFPLPLTPFELFMLLDDRPHYPMVFSVELGFQGTLDRTAFEHAVRDAVTRHPLLRARARWQGKSPRWELAEDSLPAVRWLHRDEQPSGIEPIDLSREPGLRVEVRHDDAGSTVWLQLHHACCDGLGARRFIVDLLTGYARQYPDYLPMPMWDVLDYDALRRRHQLEAKILAGTSPSLWTKIKEAFHFHYLQPRPLQAVAASFAGLQAMLVRHRFSDRETAQFREFARQGGISLNDVAMALLFQTLANWNRQHGAAADSRRIRVMMPTDLRGTLDDRMPAANRMSFSFVARTHGQCRDWQTLVAGVRKETQYFKQVQIGLDFLAGIALAQKAPSLFRFLLDRQRCMATAVLTNLGDPTKRFRRRVANDRGSPVIGNTILRHVFGTPPIRPLTYAGFGLCIASRQLCVSMLADRAAVGKLAPELMQSYVDQWRSRTTCDIQSEN